ncbi:MAG: glycosyltransferase family 4 protein [Moraxellaceae bacterium]
MILFDKRWYGDHGIGRFARMIGEGLALPALPLLGSPSGAFDPFLLAWVLRSCNASDVFFSPGYNAPFLFRGVRLLTIHDLNHLDVPVSRSFLKTLYYELFIRLAISRAARVLTVSEFSRQRIVEWSGCSPEKVVNVGNGVDPAFNADVSPWQPGFSYFLCVSNRRAHKNEERLLRAFAAADLAPDVRLVLSGEATPELLQLAAALGLDERLVFRGRVPETELPSLYRGALALVFPSLYEGFGLPVIEAMACGTAVITANTTSMPEVAGNAALLVDPLSVSEIAAAMLRLHQDVLLRQELAARGLLRAQQFSWDAVAARVRAVLDGVALIERDAAR